ncbi:MAG: DUF3616 domain-containing protein [Symplocastrum torsivum CPER-KK1]|jgi:hypothetical protein|uniref:DUF3616 domain-containing protein n=1 Tax=Symplocastrum torsivum CPER-KK1 TaxID=450513 RepID=A0A951UAR5_9CYAN|nr:DUF3616 domain-containing protein [Symplocastrum torsivum CPER-KK1]
MEHPSLLKQVMLQFQDSFKPLHEDLSAALLTPDKHLWVGSDETTTLERLTFDDDTYTFTNHQHIDLGQFIELPAGKDEEIDIEGLAYADYYLWVVGSHSWKRKKPKEDKKEQKNVERLATVASEKNRYLLARIPLVNGELFKSCPHPENPNEQLTAANLKFTERGNLLMDALDSDPHLHPFILAEIPSKDNGFDIEGILISREKVFIGMRGPVLRGWAIILELELELEANNPTTLQLKEIGDVGKLYKKHFVKLNGLGIRDLCVDGQDLLILAGPTMDLDGPVKLFRLPNGFNELGKSLSWEPTPILDLPYGEGNHHAEGITLFDPISQQPSILVVYDSPSPITHLEGATVLADIFLLG